MLNPLPKVWGNRKKIGNLLHLEAMAEEQARFKLTAESDLSQLLGDLDALIRKQNELGDENSRAVKKMDANLQAHSKQYDALGGSILSVRNMLVTAFGLSEIKDATMKVFDLTATYQKYTASLTVGLGSSKKATEALDMLQNYADKTNFTLDELAETFTKLANRGLVVSREEMVKLGDVANTLQKPFGDLVEAILDVNNTERWTELGIKAKTAGDKVQLTFKGVTIETERTEKGVLTAVAAFGTLNGVQGATAAQALTLSGRLSTLEDSAAGLGRTVGKSMTPAFEEAIESAGGLIKVVAGSNSAFDRTVDYIKAAVAAFATYQLATSAATVKTEVLSVAMAAKEVVMKAYTIAVGTSQIAMQALSSSLGANVTITTSATIAAKTFWSTLASNPIGLIITAVGLATSAYYAWKGAHAEVNVEIDAATEKLIREKVELTAAVQAVQAYSIGTEGRTKAVQELINKYPDLLGYIDADKVSNLELNKALAQQINLLDAKIRYTAAAAQAEVVMKEQQAIYSEQTAIIIKLRGAYKELSESYPDNDKFVAALKRKQEAEHSNAESMRNMSTAAMAASGSIVAYSGETAKYTELGKQATAMQANLALATTEVSKASTTSTNAQVADIERQLASLDAAHKAKKITDDKYKADRQQLLDRIKVLNQEEVDNELAKNPPKKEAREKDKEHAFFTANEIAVLVKETQAKSLQDKLDLIDANMKLEIERINTHKVDYVKTEEDAALAIEAVTIKANQAKEKLIDESRVKITAGQIDHVAKTVEIETKLTLDVQASEVQRLLNTQTTEEEKQKAKLETLEAIKKLNEEEQKVIKETEEIEKASYRERIKGIIGFLGQMSPELAQFAQFAIGVVDNIDIITGKSEQFYKKQAEDAAVAMDTSKIFFGETSGRYNQAKLKSAEANKDLAEAQAKSSAMSMDMAMALADLVKQVFGMVSTTISTSMDGVLEGLNTTGEAFQRFTDMSVQMNRDMIDAIMEDTNLSFDERKAALDEFMQYEKDTLYGNERLQNEINTAKNSVELAKWQADRQGEFVNNLTKGPEGIIANWKLVFTWRQEQSAREEELARQQTIFEQNQAISRAQQQIETYKQMADEKIRMAEELRDKEVEIEKAKNIVIENELDVLDTKRKELLDSWLARKLQDLEDDKKLALEQAATEEEKANIIIKYQGLMEKAHQEYKDAELDKTKGVKVATEELKAQEADFIKGKEDETAKAIKDINAQTAQMVRNANREIFEANKQITIAELQSEIAKLKAKRWFLNAGRVDSAISTIEGVISQIQGTQFGGGGGSGNAVEGDLGINEAYVKAGETSTEIARKAQEALQSVDQSLMDARSKTGEIDGQLQEARRKAEEAGRITIVVPKDENGVPLYEGTPYLHGLGYPDGIDTVPAWLNKGERVMPTDLNEMLGGASLSNEKLVEGYMALEKLKQKFGSVRIEEFGMLNFNLKGERLGEGIDMKGLEKRIDTLIDTVRSKKEVSINVDTNRTTVAEKSHNEQHVTYYENIYNR